MLYCRNYFIARLNNHPHYSNHYLELPQQIFHSIPLVFFTTFSFTMTANFQDVCQLRLCLTVNQMFTLMFLQKEFLYFDVVVVFFRLIIINRNFFDAEGRGRMPQIITQMAQLKTHDYYPFPNLNLTERAELVN